MSYNISEFVRVIDNLSKVYNTLPGRAATIAVAFSKERFRQQNWVDLQTESWRRRKENARQRRLNQGRGILTKTGRLRRSIRKIRVGPLVAVVGTDVPYAASHNYGYRGKVEVPAHRRNLSRRVRVTDIESRRSRTVRTSTGTIEVKAYTRTVTLPRRQFLGPSRVMATLIERDMASQVLKGIKQASLWIISFFQLFNA